MSTSEASEDATTATVNNPDAGDIVCTGVPPEVSGAGTIYMETNPSALDTDTSETQEHSFVQEPGELLQEIRSSLVTVCNEPSDVDSYLLKQRVVNIYTQDTGPKWYNAKGINITKPIVPKKLPKAFDLLPIFGRPKCKAELADFQDKKIREFVGNGLSDEEYTKLAESCSSDHLRTGAELVMPMNVPNQGLWAINSDHQKDNHSDEEDTDSDISDLCVVKKFKMRLEKDVGNRYSKKLKYRGIRIMPLTEDDGPVVTIGPLLEPGKDLLFHIRLYRPFPRGLKDKPIPISARHSVFSCDMLLLGRHKLSELRDRIVCPNDVDMRLDVSQRIDVPPHTTAKELFPSGFLFINNVFYVDSRPGCADMSARLRQWAASKPGLGTFPTKDLCSVRLDEIVVKLGHPEVYVHQGNCEHLFTISEIRLLNANDPLKISSYPTHTYVSQNQTVYCTTCAEFSAKWIVSECPRVPFDPAFFCDSCFRLYLYKDGEKIGNFKAYPYRGNEINMFKPRC